jgi:hypothetical protein
MYYNKKHEEELINRKEYKYIGSYNRNEVTLDNRNKNKKSIYIRVKCLYCGKEYDIDKATFKKGANCSNCCNKYENSFAYYIQQELKEPLNKYWDWEKNVVNPYLISKSKNIKVWIKCDKKDYHGSYKVSCNHFHSGKRCSYCHKMKVHPKDSFAQWGINTFGEDFLTKYWSPKNTLNPWELAPRSMKKIWILCQNKKYHNDSGGYRISCDKFHSGKRCSYCHKAKIHPKDSFGYLYPQKAKYWSKSNTKSPFEVAPKSRKKFRFYCEDCGEEFETALETVVSKNRSMKCRNCTSSKGEQKINKYLTDNNIEFVSQKTFKYLTGIGNGNLSYDFYLPQYNLLIEYQGKQHEKFIKGFHQSKLDFEIQKEHDRRKKKYAKDNNIELLEIWYYNYENIEEILNNLSRGLSP